MQGRIGQVAAVTPSRPLAAEDARLAGWWARLSAYAVDVVILIAITLLLREAVLVQLVGLEFHAASTGFAVGVATVTVASLLYYLPIGWAANGRTFGKMLLGTRVERPSNDHVGVGTVMWRDVVLKTAVIAALGLLHGTPRIVGLALVFADALWPLWDRENRALHDLLAGTRVVCRARGALAQAPESGETLGA